MNNPKTKVLVVLSLWAMSVFCELLLLTQVLQWEISLVSVGVTVLVLHMVRSAIVLKAIDKEMDIGAKWVASKIRSNQ